MSAMRLEDEQTYPAAVSNVVAFVEPLPGFPEERDFTLRNVGDDGVLFSLTSRRTPDLRFIVVPPAEFFPDYLPEIDESDVLPLGLADNDEVQVLVIVSVTNGIADATANLLAPIVLVPEQGTAMQVILSDDKLPLRAPLLAAAS